jgi:acyl-CoA oxidase
VTPLQECLDGRWAAVRRRLREQLRDERFRSPLGLGVDQHRARVADQLQELADSGYPRLGFPAAYGGSDDLGASVTTFEMLAFCDLSLLVKAGVQWGLFGGAVQYLGTQKHHERYLLPIITLELPGCFAMTETGHGSDVQAIRTTATYDPLMQTFDLHTPEQSAQKDYIGGAARDGKAAVVFAQLVTGGERRGVHAFLVRIRDDAGQPCPGVTLTDCGEKAGLSGVDNGRISFAHTQLPRSALLNRHGDVAADGTYSSPIQDENRRFFTMLGTLVRGRISVAGGAASATKLALTIAIRYGEVRRQFRSPDTDGEVVILDYLSHQRRLLVPLATTYALHFAQSELVASLHEVFSHSSDALARRELESRAAGIKAVTTWHATATIQACREACGGAGYLAENRIPQLKADTDVFTTFEGDNTVLMQLVAKGLLTGYREQFGDLNTSATARFLAGQLAEAVVERAALRPLAQRFTDAMPGRRTEVDLLDLGYHLTMFRWREKHVVESLVRRLQRSTRQGRDAFATFNAAQDHALLAGRAHVDRLVLEAFVAAIDRCDDPATRELLRRVCALYALSNIEADRGWFLEHGRLTPRRSKAVTQAVNALLAGLRPDARRLVDGFGIPDEVLEASIA